MNKQERIKELYFIEKYNQQAISQELNVSYQYVSKVLLSDVRYKEEKEKRKLSNQKKHTKKTIDYIKTKRKTSVDVEYEKLRQMHIQATQELSGRKTISNRAYRDWNSSVYKYNDKTKSYHLKKGIIAGADVPKKINWKNF